MLDDLYCLNCTLPICDDRSKDCRYRLVQIEKRQDYFKEYYQANREAILVKAKERKWKRLTKHQRYHRKNREARNQYLRDYRAKKRNAQTGTL